MKTKQNKQFQFFLTLFALGMTIAFAFFFGEVARLNGLVFTWLMQGVLIVATCASAYHDYLNWIKK